MLNQHHFQARKGQRSQLNSEFTNCNDHFIITICEEQMRSLMKYFENKLENNLRLGLLVDKVSHKTTRYIMFPCIHLTLLSDDGPASCLIKAKIDVPEGWKQLVSVSLEQRGSGTPTQALFSDKIFVQSLGLGLHRFINIWFAFV